MLDGAARIKDVMKAAAADGQPAIGMTDHGNMYGTLDFYSAAKDAGIKPIIGSELYMALNSRHERPTRRGKVDDGGGEDNKGEKLYYHLIALAENNEGYQNLIKLSSRAYLEGYFYKPRTDYEMFAEHSKGVIATTGCLGGVTLQALLQGDEKAALERAGKLQDIFGRDNLFVEIQDHGLAEQKKTNPMLIELARKLKAPLLATNDSHYVNREDHLAHDALLCVQTGSNLDDPNRFKFDGEEHYLKTAREMRELFKDYPEACDNTLWIAERANVEIEFGNPKLPEFPLPDGFTTQREYLRHLTFEGARKRYAPDSGELPAEVNERLDYELGVIANMGFDSYFLVVWDLVRFAKHEAGIRVGPGRGSAAGCAVAYCLEIVDLDPIKYDLLFERFLNPGRKQMPDIDMDFDDNRRPEMIKYAARMYGWDHVAQIVTFGTIKARAAVRDAARVLGLPYGVGDKIAKLMPPLVMGRDTPLYACLEEHPKYADGYKMAAELRDLYSADPEAKKVIDVAGGLEGLRRSDGIHAAAVVITNEPLTNYLPIQRKPGAKENPEDAPIVTQYEMHGVESLGLLKMDFLGLRNLSVIERCLDLIQFSEGQKLGPDADVPRFDIDNVPLDDEPTLEMLRKGDSIGVFQLEGTAMRALMRALAPTEFEDVAALVALYRPGPMAANMHMDYADRKNGRKPIEYLHPDMADVLGDTYGLCIYQEEMMRLSQKFAGFTLEEADNLRKAAGKKIREVMAKQRVKFVEGCVNTGYGQELGTALFDMIEPFADYAFNKSHSYGYGFVSFQTAYLKAHYPTEYLAALLGSVKDDKDKTAIYLAECRALGIEVRVPDVNESESDFIARHPDETQTGVIPFGLSGVRNVGEALVEKIVAERDKAGPFVDFYDFCQRVDTSVLNRKALDSLIKAGGFDSLGHPRQGLLSVYEQIVDATVARRKEHDMGVMSLFGGGGDGGPNFDDARVPIPEVEFDKAPKLALEKEMLGLYVSDHPLMGAEAALRKHTDCSISELREGNAGDMRVVGGIVTNLSKRYTKRGDLMATFLLEDLQYNIECWVFPKTMQEWGSLLANDAIVCIKGRLDDRDDQTKLVVMEVKRPELILDGGPPVRLDVPSHRLTDTLVTDLKKLFVDHPGDSPVYIQVDTSVMRLPDDFNVNAGNGLMGELRVLLGPDCFIG
jgi:DNA polymerase-3 subunit alpha